MLADDSVDLLTQVLSVTYAAPREVRSQMSACMVDWFMGRILSSTLFVTAHVMTVHQFLQAFNLVAGAVPKGAMTSELCFLASIVGCTL